MYFAPSIFEDFRMVWAKIQTQYNFCSSHSIQVLSQQSREVQFASFYYCQSRKSTRKKMDKSHLYHENFKTLDFAFYMSQIITIMKHWQF